jgi:hypothetical protein
MFFDSLAIQLNMGRPIAEAFVDAAGNSGDPELYQIFTAVAPKLRSGQSLPSCLKPYEERFPELVMCVLNVGEVSGGISGAAQRLADTYKQMVAMQRSLSNNSFSPVKILLILCFIDMVLVLIHELGRNGDNLSGLALTFTVVTSVGIFAATVIAEVYIARAILHQMYRWKPALDTWTRHCFPQVIGCALGSVVRCPLERRHQYFQCTGSVIHICAERTL